MKKAGLFFIITVIVLSGCKIHELAIDGQKGYKIVYSDDADSLDKRAALQLQHYLKEMSKARLPLVEESKYKDDKAIYIGSTDYANNLNIDFEGLREDGYAFKKHNNNFDIAGGTEKGALYGVYDLLEHIGFRKYTPGSTHIPARDSISFPANDTVVVPEIRFREVLYTHAYKQDYFDWHKLDAHSKTWGFWVHTFNRLVPPEKYGDTHPEYYSLVNGKRRPGTQLCLSNPEVFEVLVKNLRESIDENPGYQYWSVSQNDNANHCQCEQCQKLNEKYGGVPSGSILHFVNKVAREFPDKTISTLAYWYSREAPENIKPESNVNIMLCNIESERHLPITQTDPAFAKDIKEWGKLTDNILVWDYIIQFRNLISPFPNLHTLKPNIQFFTRNHVTSLFEQGNREVGGEMAELRAYLVAKLMWNPEADDEAIIDEFVHGYYGAAGKYIKQYIDTMKTALLDSGHHLRIFGNPVEAKDTYLSADLMGHYRRLFDAAESAVEDKPELLRRVKIARLPLMYARLEIARTEMNTPRSLYEEDGNGDLAIKPGMKTLLHRFVELCNDQGVTRLKEWSTPPDVYRQSYSRLFNKLDDQVVSVDKKIIPVTQPSEKYAPSGLKALTDGVFGSYDFSTNWIGYEGKHMEFILDLGKVMEIKSVNMDFLNSVKDWIFLPEYVTYQISVDGEHYKENTKVRNPNDTGNRERMVQSFKADINDRARYIKVHAESPLECPSWHPGAGNPAWIFADEIVVK